MANHSESTRNDNTKNEVAMPPKQQIKLPPPHRYITVCWDSSYLKEACEKSRAALSGMKRRSSGDHDGTHQFSHLMHAMDVQNLFLIGSKRVEYVIQLDYATIGRDLQWGSRDIMLDLGAGGCPRRQERLEHLQEAAKFRGGAVYLLNLGLSTDEKSAWLESILSVSSATDGDGDADGDGVGPKSLLITNYAEKIDDLLKALQRSKGLHHLSLQFCHMKDECVQVLSDLRSLRSLHLFRAYVSPQFVTTLAGLHASPLAASLQRLAIQETLLLSNNGAVFLQRWQKLKELALIQDEGSMAEEALLECMDALSRSMKDSTSPEPRFYSLSLGPFHDSNLVSSRTTVAAIVDALSKSGLPFLEMVGVTAMDPAVNAQILRNQRQFTLGALEKVKATSMRLFICGDPYAGKTTLLSTMHSIHAPKRHKLLRKFLACAHILQNRTQGIEVRSITKDGIRLSLWDMAGQQEFHAFHDCMFPDTGASIYQTPSMFMFVWSPIHSSSNGRRYGFRYGSEKKPEEFEESFRYWLKFLASKRRQSNATLKVIVVFTRADQMELLPAALSSSITSLRKQFKEVIDIVEPAFEVDARKKGGPVNDVLECIFDIAKQILQDVEVYNICTQVSEHLSEYSKMTKQRIITWSEFSDICIRRFPVLDDEARLQAIALTLNDSGVIIYVNNAANIVLDPNWFCSQIIGSLIHFAESTSSKRTMKIQGFADRVFLEKKLESITKSEAKGSLLVDLMEAMHLCCKVLTSNGDRLFIPATLTTPKEIHVGFKQLRWKSTPNHADYTYMGRRLECENKDLNFLTPGLFPRIQVLLNNGFRKVHVDVTLGKDFIHICMSPIELIVVFCKAQVDNMIDVLVRASTKSLDDMSITLDYITRSLIEVCAQPSGIQGVKLMESVLQPESLHDPSMARNREDHCIEMKNLKQMMRQHLQQGPLIPKNHVANESDATKKFINLVGYEKYREEASTYHGLLVDCRDELDELQVHDKVTKSKTMRFDSKKVHNEIDNMLLLGDQNSLVGGDAQLSRIEAMIMLTLRKVQNVNYIVLDNNAGIRKLNDKVDEMSKKIDEIHKGIVELQSDVVSKIETILGKLSKFRAMENESEESKLPLPGFILLTTDGISKARKLVTHLTRYHSSSVRMELLCEAFQDSKGQISMDGKHPHRVEDQPGITMDCQSEKLQKAIPYVNVVLRVLTIAAQVGINILAPSAASFLPDWAPQLSMAKNYPFISDAAAALGPERSLSTASSMNRMSMAESSRMRISESSSEEWQKRLADILADHGGVTEENIAQKFRLKRAIHRKPDGSCGHIAWVCDKHYRAQRPF